MTSPDGKIGIVPPESSVLNNPIPDVVGGTISGLDKYYSDASDPRALPKSLAIDFDQAGKLSTGMKFGGPAVSAPCEAGISSAVGFGAGVAGGALGTFATGTPMGTAVGAAGFGYVGSALGAELAKKVCS